MNQQGTPSGSTSNPSTIIPVPPPAKKALLLGVLRLIACLETAVVLYFSFLPLQGFFAAEYPAGTLVLLPWGLGLAGLLGLLACFQPRAKTGRFMLQTRMAMLFAGLLAALIFTALVSIFLLVARSNFQPAFLTVMLPLFLLVFPGLSALSAVLELFRARALLKQHPAPAAPGYHLRHSLLLTALIMASPLLGRILVQETLMAWYGRDFVNAASRAAETLAEGRDWCLYDGQGSTEFTDLDKRRILEKAVAKHLEWNRYYTDPHFGIYLDGKMYLWSFRSRQFYHTPGRGPSFSRPPCTPQQPVE